MWERITQDTFTLILTYISPSETLLTIRRVCKTWKKLSEHSLLWKVKYFWKKKDRALLKFLKLGILYFLLEKYVSCSC